MEFLLLFTEQRRGEPAEPGGFAEMKKFAGELADQGKLRRGAPLGPDSAGARVRVRDGKAFVSDGPFAESKEVVGGFWIVDVAGREEAIEIARRTPHARYGTVEVHPVGRRYTFTDTGEGTPFLFAFRMEPGLTDPDGAKLREMVALRRRSKREGTLLETAPLAARAAAGARRDARRKDAGDRRAVRGGQGGGRRVRPRPRRGPRGGDRAREALPARPLGPGRGARDPLLRRRVSRSAAPGRAPADMASDLDGAARCGAVSEGIQESLEERRRVAAGADPAARCKAATSIFCICSIASVARRARSGSGSPRSWPSCTGTICHDTP